MSTPAPAPIASSTPQKPCFNPLCPGDPKPESTAPRKKAWRLRSGEYAELCDRCFCSYEQGNFCDTFHSDASGWRNCESCAKRVHTGCIVSAPTYMLLDAGGVECVACARKGLMPAPKQVWSSQVLLPVSERPKDFAVKGRNQIAGSVHGQWRQASNMWNVASAQSELHQRLAFEFDRPSRIERMISATRSSSSANEKKIEDPADRIAPSKLNHVTRERDGNGTVALNSVSSLNRYCGEAGKAGSIQDSSHRGGENEPALTSKGLSTPFPSSTDTDLEKTSTAQRHPQTSSPVVRPVHPSSHNMVDPNGEVQAHMRNGRPPQDAHSRDQVLPRYRPRLTDQELQQISGDSKSVITPLFEKMLSASDAGKMGRLVLPKKCAEAYFPPISQSEGLPLKVQDATGKEWMFQFRFWPNNNSRMYVLEGVTPCIQSMQLQAGDTVTFSRIDPEGKLVMGHRKSSSMSPEQDNQPPKSGNGSATPPEANYKNVSADSFPNLPPRPFKGNTEPRNPTNTTQQGTPEKSTYTQKDGSSTKSSAPIKRKGSTLGPKSKRLRIDHEDSIHLKLTWEAAQDLLRPPPNGVPSVVVIDGHEFEEYEEAPVIGMPTFFVSTPSGDKFQWARCEDCSKWRKLPGDALLPSRWTCSDNTWDPERSSCSSAQEQSAEQLADVLPIKTGAAKRSKIKTENDSVEVSDGLDTLANLAILGEGEELPPSSQPSTTKHPRHRPGCTCIVCIQPPSGKGPKHEATCTCNVCLSIKRRFKTLMLRREKRQSEKEAESTRKKQQPIQSSEMSQMDSDSSPNDRNIGSFQVASVKNEGTLDDESERRKTLTSPLKTQIDLNIQPERDEMPSPVANSSSMARAFSSATT